MALRKIIIVRYVRESVMPCEILTAVKDFVRWEITLSWQE